MEIKDKWKGILFEEDHSPQCFFKHFYFGRGFQIKNVFTKL